MVTWNIHVGVYHKKARSSQVLEEIHQEIRSTMQSSRPRRQPCSMLYADYSMVAQAQYQRTSLLLAFVPIE